MELTKLIRDIKQGMTGDTMRDAIFLSQKLAPFRGSSQELELAHACDRLLIDEMTEAERNDYRALVIKEIRELTDIMPAVITARDHGDFEKALSLFRPVIDRVESTAVFDETDQYICHSYREPFELIYYDYKVKTDKQIIGISVDIDSYYQVLGSLETDLKNPIAAKTSLLKGLLWNPMNTGLLLDLAELCREDHDITSVRQLLDEIFPVVYVPAELAHAYRLLVWYFTERANWKAALLCIGLAESYGSEDMSKELALLLMASEGQFPALTMEETEKLLKDENIPVGPSSELLAVARIKGEELMQPGTYRLAASLLKIFCDLYPDEKEAKDLLQEAIKGMAEESTNFAPPE